MISLKPILAYLAMLATIGLYILYVDAPATVNIVNPPPPATDLWTLNVTTFNFGDVEPASFSNFITVNVHNNDPLNSHNLQAYPKETVSPNLTLFMCNMDGLVYGTDVAYPTVNPDSSITVKLRLYIDPNASAQTVNFHVRFNEYV